MTKLRTFLAGLLLVPVLTLNAAPIQTGADRSGLDTQRSQSGTCWYYYQGTWIEYPC